MVGTAWTKVYQGNTRNIARTSPGHQKVLRDRAMLSMMICTRRESERCRIRHWPGAAGSPRSWRAHL